MENQNDLPQTAPDYPRHSGRPEGRIQNLQAMRDSGQARVTGFEMGSSTSKPSAPSSSSNKKHKISLAVISILVLILILPFVPFPYYQFENVQCKVDANCPGKGWHWGPSLWQTLTYSTSGRPIEDSRIINSSPTPSPYQTNFLWENSVCGNGICEQCESINECCNVPCNEEGACPPPTCLGHCAKDCDE